MAQANVLAPTADRIMDSIIGFQVSGVLKGAIDLDLFTKIAEGNNTVPALAAATGASEKGIRVISDYLTVRGFLTKSGDTYSLAPDAEAFLNKHSPMYFGSVMNFFGSEEISGRFKDVASAVKRGGTVFEVNGTSPENPMWIEFARSMMPMMMLPANLTAVNLSKEPISKVLDIAAGHGVYGIQIGLQNPGAQIVGLDWKNVLPLAVENAQKFGVGDRYSTIPGSAFDVDFGTGYDVVLVPNFLHHFNYAENVALLKKIRAALNDGGRVAIVEFVPNEDRVSPPFPAMFSMMMLGTTPEGDAYTEAELRSMLQEAGFSLESRMDLEPSPATLLVGRRV